MSIRLRSAIRIVRRRYLSIIYWIVRALAILMIPFGLGVSLVYAQNTEPPDQAPVTTAPDGVNQDNAETTTQEQNIPNLAIGVSNTTADLPTGFALGLGGASTATLLALAGSTNARGGQTTASNPAPTTSNPAPTTTRGHINQTSASREQTNPPLVAQVTSVSSLEEDENEEAEEEGGFSWPDWALPVVGFISSQSQSFWQTLVRTGQHTIMPGLKLVVQGGKVVLVWVVAGITIAKLTVAALIAGTLVLLFESPVGDGEIPQQERERLERERLERERQQGQQMPSTPSAPPPQLPAEYEQWQQNAYQFVQNVGNGLYSNSSEDYQAAVAYLQSLQTLNQELIGAGLPPVTSQEFIDQVDGRLRAGRYVSQISYYIGQAEAGESVDLEMFRQLTNDAQLLSERMEANWPGMGFYSGDIRRLQLDWMRDLQQQNQYVSEINDYIARAEAGEPIDYPAFEQLTNDALYLSNQMATRWSVPGFYTEEIRQNHLLQLQNGTETPSGQETPDSGQETPNNNDVIIYGPDGRPYGGGGRKPPRVPPTTTSGGDDEEAFRRELERLRNEIKRLQELANENTQAMNAAQRQAHRADISNRATSIRQRIDAIKGRVNQSQNLTSQAKQNLLDELNLLYNRVGSIEFNFFRGQSRGQRLRDLAEKYRLNTTVITALTGALAYLTWRNNQLSQQSLEIQRITEERLSTLPTQSQIALQQAEVNLRLQFEANERARVMGQRMELLEDYRLRLEEYNADRERYQDESQAYANAQAAYNAAVQQYNADMAAYNVAVQQRQTWRDQRDAYRNYVNSSMGRTRISRLLEAGGEWTLGDPLDGYALPEGPEPTVPVEPQVPVQNLPPQPLPPTVQRPAVPTLPAIPVSEAIPDPDLLRIPREANLEELDQIEQRHRELFQQFMDEAAELEEPLPPEVQEQLDQQNPPPQPQSYQSPPIPTTPIASSPQTITYTVQPGDTLETIAQRFYGSENTVVPDIAQLNALEDSEILQTGQEVQVPVYN